MSGFYPVFIFYHFHKTPKQPVNYLFSTIVRNSDAMLNKFSVFVKKYVTKGMKA